MVKVICVSKGCHVWEGRGGDVHFVGKGCHVWCGERHNVRDIMFVCGRGWVVKVICVSKGWHVGGSGWGCLICG